VRKIVFNSENAELTTEDTEARIGDLIFIFSSVNLCASVTLCETTRQCSYNAARFTQSHRGTEIHRAITGKSLMKSFVPSCANHPKNGLSRLPRLWYSKSVSNEESA